jgi:hypothetical protein
MSTSETRAESHVKVISTQGARHQQILDYLSVRGMGRHRAQISKGTGISEASLCGRLKELVDADRVLVGKKVWNPDTKRNVVTYKVPYPLCENHE